MYKNVGKVLCVMARIVGIMGMIASLSVMGMSSRIIL